MKKITLFAAAALVASAAMATPPAVQLKSAGKVQRATRVMTPAMMRAAAELPAEQLTISAAVAKTAAGADDVVTIQNDALYVPTPYAFHLGMTPGTAFWGGCAALTGIRNNIPFPNLTQGADAQVWTWKEPVGLNADKTDYIYDVHTSADQHLFVDLKPDMFFDAPQLDAVFGTDTVSYVTPRVLMYHCGGSAASLGYTTAEKGTPLSEITIDQIGGMTVAAMPIEDFLWYPLNAFVVPSTPGMEQVAPYFNASGAAKDWEEIITEAIDFRVQSTAVTGYTTLIPPMPSAYQLGSMWTYFTGQVTADFPLIATVYNVTENGIDYANPIAQGEVTLTADTLSFPNDPMADLPIIDFYAFDADGYPTDMYPCISAGKACAVEISGFNPSNCNYFIPLMYDGSKFLSPQAEIATDLYPMHAFVNLDVVGNEMLADSTYSTKLDTISLESANPYFYLASPPSQDTIAIASDYAMYFNVEFPSIVNLGDGEDAGTANFNVHFENAGGKDTVALYCDYNIQACLEEGIMEASASADWLTFTTAFVEPEELNSYPYTVVDLVCEELPKGEEGRSGYVLFTGNGCDFMIRVTQGDVAGIGEVTALPKAHGLRYYDLQGRRLGSAPAKGIFIEVAGDKATKRLAR